MIDFLQLHQTDLCNNRLVIFYGESGSGKSSYLRYFFEKYKEKSTYYFHYDTKIQFETTKKELIFLDEISSFSQIYTVIRFLLDGKKVIVASHIDPYFYAFLFPFYKTKYFLTDRNNGKIEQILTKKGYTYSPESIQVFLKKYSGNFNRLQIILETGKNKHFDSILQHFEKYYSLDQYKK